MTYTIDATTPDKLAIDYLTKLLLPSIQKSQQKTRIINLTSGVQKMMPYSLWTNFMQNIIDTDNNEDIRKWFKTNWNYTSYSGYGFSKALLILFTRELSNRYADIDCCSVDPGLIKTEISRKNVTNFGWFGTWERFCDRLWVRQYLRELLQH